MIQVYLCRYGISIQLILHGELEARFFFGITLLFKKAGPTAANLRSYGQALGEMALMKEPTLPKVNAA